MRKWKRNQKSEEAVNQYGEEEAKQVRGCNEEMKDEVIEGRRRGSKSGSGRGSQTGKRMQ